MSIENFSKDDINQEIQMSELEAAILNTENEIKKASSDDFVLSDKELIKNFDNQVEFIEENGDKKYVIRVEKENVAFFDKLSSTEKDKFLNENIVKYIKNYKKETFIYKFVKLLKHALIVTFTAIISIPIIYYVINYSLVATINNYNEAKANFEKLYLEKGGIKKKDLTKLRKLQ